MAGHKWYVAAFVLILGAIAAEGFAKYHTGHATSALARAAAYPAERPQLRQVGAWHAHRAGQGERVSLGLAALAIGSWVISRSRREGGSLGVLLVLHCFFVLLTLLMV